MVRSLKELYDLLRTMIVATQAGNKEEVLKLNKTFDVFAFEIFGNSPSKLGAKYNNCRQYCIMAITTPNGQQFLSYATDIFLKLPEPKR